MGKRARNKQRVGDNVLFMDEQDHLFENSYHKNTRRNSSPNSKYRKNIVAKTDGQSHLLRAIDESDIVFAVGPAGTGKTYLAIAKAVEALLNDEVERIILTRPAVEAGEKLGFLPGDMEDKLDPYLRPLYDALLERVDSKKLEIMLRHKVIEIAPVGFMRGRTLSNAYIVIDEAQNCTESQLKMLLTRLGWNSTMIITGDPDQSDLEKDASGLKGISDRLAGKIDRLSVCKLDKADVVRHPLVSKLLDII